jgi:outer membrane protein OmpA-like peptidoglycan-associated protein
LTLGGLTSIAQAQVPQAAAEAVAVASAGDPLLEAPPRELEQGAGFRADSGGPPGYLHRYPPQAQMAELGVFIGPLFISDGNSFRGPTIVYADRAPTVKPISTFAQPAIELGIRGGYFPLSFLGGELEGMVAIAQTDTDEGVTILAARVQAVAQLPYWSIVPFVAGGVGYWNVRNDVSGNDSDPAFHYGGGVKLNVSDNLAVRLDLRDSITNQRGGGGYPHNVEALAGANLVLGRASEKPKDRDRDGVFDERDQCPDEPGTATNGCPVRDLDSDGLVEPDDQCPTEAGRAPTGCPILDADADGLLDSTDQCVNEKGEAPSGCPDDDRDGFVGAADRCPTVLGAAPDGCLADQDGDGISGVDDHCPDRPETMNGFQDTDGCPDELPAALQEFVGVIAGIEFDNNQAAIRPSSEASLDKAFRVLEDYPTLRIEVIGHTDDRGAREHNVDLSLRRAEAVKQRLVAKGIDASRIQSNGAGPDVPITTNDTAAGRQQNRRIEFRIVP